MHRCLNIYSSIVSYAQLLNEEITPTVQKLKAERATYLEFQKVQRELDHLTKVYLAYQFICAEQTAKESAQSLEEVNAKVVKIQGTIKGEIMIRFRLSLELLIVFKLSVDH